MGLRAILLNHIPACKFDFFFSHERFLDKLALLQIKLIGEYKGNYTLSELHISIRRVSARRNASELKEGLEFKMKIELTFSIK